MGEELEGDRGNRPSGCLPLNFGNTFLHIVEKSKKPRRIVDSKKKEYALRERKGVSTLGTKQRQYARIRCHYCRTMNKDRAYIVCSRYPTCRCGFCFNCLKEIFKIELNSLTEDWICLTCREICNCNRCLKRREYIAESVRFSCDGKNLQRDKQEGFDEDMNFQVGKRRLSTGRQREEIAFDYVAKDSSRYFNQSYRQPSSVTIPRTTFVNPLSNFPMLYTHCPQPYFLPSGPSNMIAANQLCYPPVLQGTYQYSQLPVGYSQSYPLFMGSSSMSMWKSDHQNVKDEVGGLQRQLQEQRRERGEDMNQWNYRRREEWQ